MKVCYFGIYHSDFGRNKVYISGLKKRGVEVIECFDHTPGIAKYLNLIKKHQAIKNSYDVMIVGFPGYTVVWLARLLTKKPIIFDALCTHYEAQVLSRGIYPLFSINRLLTWIFDHSAVALSDVVLVETNNQKKFFQDHFRLSNRDKVKVVLTGADDSVFYPLKIEKYPKFTAIFRGRYLTEAGLKYIIEAAKLLENDNIDVQIIGSGHTKNEVDEAIKKFAPKNLTLISRELAQDEIKTLMQKGHVSLGQFADHDRLSRTIPHKAFESLAMKMPYITSRAKGHEGFLKDKENCLMVEPANAKDIADKIKLLKNQPDLAEIIAENGYELYRQAANPEVLGKLLEEIIAALIP